MSVSEVKLDNTAKTCSLINEDGTIVGIYPYVWLRDNCRCTDCFHNSCRSRLFFLKNLDLDIIPTAAVVKKSDQDGELYIHWSDEHDSHFAVSWLRENTFSNMTEDPVSFPKRLLWGKEMRDKIPCFTCSDILSSDKALHDWIEALQIHGIALIKEAPQTQGVVLEIGKRISVLKATNYGETFNIISKSDASTLGLTTTELELHTDLAYYAYPANIQLLHCIKQVKTKGGENQFCDGFKVAEDLRHNDPEVFHILSTTSIDFRDVSADKTECHMKYRTPVIEIHRDGRYKAITYCNAVRAPYMHVPVENVHNVYKAIKIFDSEMNKQENKIEIKLTEGDIACFDNQRVLHGRSGFEVTETSIRHLEGAYMDWDAMCSRRRVIRDKMFNLQPL